MLAGMFEENYKLYGAEILFIDLIQSAHLAGLISGETETLIYDWLKNNEQHVH